MKQKEKPGFGNLEHTISLALAPNVTVLGSILCVLETNVTALAAIFCVLETNATVLAPIPSTLAAISLALGAHADT